MWLGSEAGTIVKNNFTIKSNYSYKFDLKDLTVVIQKDS